MSGIKYHVMHLYLHVGLYVYLAHPPPSPPPPPTHTHQTLTPPLYINYYCRLSDHPHPSDNIAHRAFDSNSTLSPFKCHSLILNLLTICKCKIYNLTTYTFCIKFKPIQLTEILLTMWTNLCWSQLLQRKMCSSTGILHLIVVVKIKEFIDIYLHALALWLHIALVFQPYNYFWDIYFFQVRKFHFSSISQTFSIFSPSDLNIR